MASTPAPHGVNRGGRLTPARDLADIASEHAQARRELRARWRTGHPADAYREAADLLENPPAYLTTVGVSALLRSLPGLSARRARGMMAAVQLPTHQPVHVPDLTSHASNALAVELRLAAEGLDELVI